MVAEESRLEQYMNREKRWPDLHVISLRTTEDQWLKLAHLCQNILTSTRKARKANPDLPFERITNNTLVRVAIELLFEFQDNLTGNTEAELTTSVRTAVQHLRNQTTPASRRPRSPKPAKWSDNPQLAGRITEEQWITLTMLRQHIVLTNRKAHQADPDLPFERITNNTLVRVAIELLFEFQDNLTGNTEAELTTSVRTAVQHLRNQTTGSCPTS